MYVGKGGVSKFRQKPKGVVIQIALWPLCWQNSVLRLALPLIVAFPSWFSAGLAKTTAERGEFLLVVAVCCVRADRGQGGDTKDRPYVRQDLVQLPRGRNGWENPDPLAGATSPPHNPTNTKIISGSKTRILCILRIYIHTIYTLFIHWRVTTPLALITSPFCSKYPFFIFMFLNL